MPNADDLNNQRILLATYRRTLAIQLDQRATLGAAYTPPRVINGISEGRSQIARIKSALRESGADVSDDPNDAEPVQAAQALLATLPLDVVPAVALLPTHSRMPFSANPLFVGRTANLMALAATLYAGQTTVIAAATGIGGIGKTQLASEFVYRYGQYFAGGVFWLSFAEAGSIEAEIATCGRSMQLPGFDGLAFADQVARVRQVWQEPTPRLLVFDNCEDAALLRRYRPTSGGCRVLLTSRRAHWDAALGIHEQRIETLPRADSIALLRQFRPDLAANDADLDALANDLGNLPLALHVAGSYLQRYQREVTPAAYRARLQSAPLQAFALRAAVETPTSHERDVALTFAASYTRLGDSETDRLALALLARFAHFAPGEPLPRWLLALTVAEENEEAASEDDQQDEEATERALLLADVVARLGELGLVDEAPGDELRLHRLIAAFVQSVAADDGAQAAVEQVLIATTSRLNNEGYPAPLLALEAHVRHSTDAASERVDEQAAALCNELGYHLDSVADYAGARPYYERALAINEQALGPSHPDTASSLNNLGALLQNQGDYAGARPYYERALAICEQALGPNHPTTATSLNNLGVLLANMEDFAEALPLMRWALAIRNAVLGPAHPDTQSTARSLAAIEQAASEG